MRILEIISDYDAIALKNDKKHRQRLEEVFRVCPKLQEVWQEIELTQVQRLSNALFINPEKRKFDDETFRSLLQKKVDLLKASGFDAEYLDPIYNCPLCKDTGYSDLEKTIYCTCVFDKLYAHRKRELRHETSIEDFDFKAYTNEEHKKILQTIVSNLKIFLKKYPETKNKILVLSGGTGVGKTFLLKSLTNSLLTMGVDALYATAFEMFGKFHSHRLGSDADIEQYENAEVLLIDDLGTEANTTNVTVEYFYRLLELRKYKLTFIATNLTPGKQMIDKYVDRIFSRLVDERNAKWYMIKGVDLRLS